MAGVKGRSGGARPNSGPKPKYVAIKATDSLEFLREVFQNDEIDVKTRLRAALGAAQYEHAKMGEGGKSAAKKAAADAAGAGKFATPAAPRLAVDNTK